MNKKMPKALVLFSGGLDSMLAAKYLTRQGFDVTCLVFKSVFFNDENAQKSALRIGAKLLVADFSCEHLAIVKKPQYGYGSSVNPCIDCHLLMIKKAKEILEKEGFDFVATGEVLGQRPMSQNKQSLELIRIKSGLGDKLFRPLSGKLLDKTIVQKNGWLKDGELLDVSGRSRQKQLALAKEWGIKEYPTPSGGCILTEKEFGQRLKALTIAKADYSENDAALMRFGLHHWIGGNLIIITRDKLDEAGLLKFIAKGDICIKMENIPGPLALIRKFNIESNENLVDSAKEFILRRSPKAKGAKEINFSEKRYGF